MLKEEAKIANNADRAAYWNTFHTRFNLLARDDDHRGAWGDGQEPFVIAVEVNSMQGIITSSFI